MTVRMLAPSNVQKQTVTVFGQVFSAAPGAFVDVPQETANALQSNGWVRVGLVGPTSARPSGPPNPPQGGPALFAGAQFYDTTVGAWLTYDGAAWRDPTGAAR